MKTIYLFIITLLLPAMNAVAQRNIFPLPSGRVGIGTDTPTVLLDVTGEFKLGVKEHIGGSA